MTAALPLLVASLLTGSFCIGDDCREVALEPSPVVIEVPLAEESRTFTIRMRGGSAFVLGQIPPGASRLTLDRSHSGTAIIRAASRHDEPIPPIRARITSRDGPAVWNVNVTPTAARHELTLFMPPGNYEVALETPTGRMKADRGASLDVETGRNVESAWQWVRQLRGSVRAADLKTPIEGAEIVDSEGDLLTVTDSEGAFLIDELEPPRQPQIGVRAAGFGARWVPLPYESLEIGTVELFRGATVGLTVDHPTATEPLPLEIQVREDHRDATQPLFEGRGSTGGRVELTDLPPGKLRLIISGPEPLQRFSKAVEISGDAELRVAISPVETRVVVMHGDELLPRASVEIRGDGGWRGTATSNAKGEFEAEMWDRGDLMLTVKAAPLKAPYVTMERRVADGPRFIEIEIPATILRGRIHGEGKALPDAKVRIRSASDGGTSHERSADVGNDGQFEITALPAGQHELSVTAPGYLEKRIELATQARDDVHELKIELQRGYELHLKIRAADGQPVPRALIAVAATPEGFLPERTFFAGENGEARLTLAPASKKSMFAVDRLGRFAHATVSADRADQEEVITIPQADGTLAVRVLGTNGEPVAGIGVRVRYNGVFLPEPTLMMMLAARNTGKLTGADGTLDLTRLPAGRYELFPWSNPQELRNQSQPGRKAAVDVVLDGRTVVPVRIIIESKATEGA